MEQIERIREMEKKLDAAAAAVHALDSALERYRDSRENLRALEAYLNSEARRQDLAADEAGLLPAGLKRGVLSEDGIYSLLEENDELLLRLKQL